MKKIIAIGLFKILIVLNALNVTAESTQPPYVVGDVETNENFIDIYKQVSEHGHTGTDGSSQLKNIYQDGSSGNVGIGTTSPSGLFQVGGGTLTVLSGGNVGIGTSAPVSTLQIGTPSDSTYTYFHVDVSTNTPPVSACNEESERGRVYAWLDVGIELYVCKGATGWSHI